MKSFYATFIILIVVTTNLYSQFELRDKAISDPKFEGEQFILEDPQRIIGPGTLDSIIMSTMETYHIPGLAALIVKHDEIIWNRNFGYANVALNRSVEDSTLFWMASVSKTIMATAIMQLWEDGLFNLDDNINPYLQPDFQVINPLYPLDTITFKMLMTHTSSIRDNNSILNPLLTCGDSPVPLDSFLINYYTPGGIYYSTANFYGYAPSDHIRNYTNAGACVLAYLVEKLSWMSFDQYCRENIFDPLDMDETSWFLDGLDTTKVATPYDWSGGQYVARCHQGWPIYPIAFLRTNKIEFEHFLSAYMNWGTYNGATILDSTTIDLMLTVHIPSNDQGLIWYKTQISPEYLLWGHPGGQQGVGTMIFFYPKEDWGFIVFFNVFPSFAAYFDIAHAISNYASEYVPREPLLSLTHTPGDLNMGIFNDGSIGPEITWKSQNGLFGGTPLFGTAAAGSVNGQYPFSGIIDLVNLSSNFASGFTSEPPNFDQVTEAFLNDSNAPTPFGVDIIQRSYSNSGEEHCFIRYGYVNATDSTLSDFYAGMFIDWDIDANTNTTNSGGYALDRNLVYQFDNSGTPYYYGVATLDGLTGYRIASRIPSPIRQEAFTWISTPDPDPIGPPGDFHSWQGAGPVDIAPGDTAWFTFAIVAGDDLDSIRANARAAATKSGNLGWTPVVGVSEDENLIPKEFALEQNYPNPFNPTTQIQYGLPQRGRVKLTIYNVLGQKVATLVNDELNVGTYTTQWNAVGEASGVYFYRLQAGGFVDTKKLLLLR